MRRPPEPPSASALAERALLGSLLIDPFLWPLQAQLRPSDFGSHHRAAVLLAMRAVNASRRPVDDLILVLAELERSGVAPPAGKGWAESLASLLDGDYLAEESRVQEYVRVIREAAAERRAARRHGLVAVERAS